MRLALSVGAAAPSLIGFDIRIQRSQSRYSPINGDVIHLMNQARDLIRAQSGAQPSANH